VEQLKAAFKRSNGPDQGLTWTQHFLCGAGAGIANSVVSGPVEHIRSRLQVQSGSKGAALEYNGTVDAVRKVYQRHGLSGLYKGQNITLIRYARHAVRSMQRVDLMLMHPARLVTIGARLAQRVLGLWQLLLGV